MHKLEFHKESKKQKAAYPELQLRVELLRSLSRRCSNQSLSHAHHGTTILRVVLLHKLVVVLQEVGLVQMEVESQPSKF